MRKLLYIEDLTEPGVSQEMGLFLSLSRSVDHNRQLMPILNKCNKITAR